MGVALFRLSCATSIADRCLISQRIPGAIPIADDGGGNFVYYGRGRNGPGLYCCGYGDIDHVDAIWIAPSLKALLEQQAAFDPLP